MAPAIICMLGWDPTRATHTAKRKARAFLAPRLLSWEWDARAVLASARRIRWSICAPHAGQFDLGVTLFLEVPFRQLWCITSLSRKKCPALTGPRQAWATTPAELGIRVLLPEEVLAARIISARTPKPYRRMKLLVVCPMPDSWRAIFAPVRADRLAIDWG